MGINGKKGSAVIAAVAVFAVALLITSAMATDPPEQEVQGDVHQYYVVYQPNGATISSSNASSVAAGYDGIISTEYNPERWYDEDKQGMSRSTPSNLPEYSAGTYDNWVGPQFTATGTMKLTFNLSNSTTYTISIPGSYTISAEKASWMGGENDPVIVNEGNNHTLSFTTSANGGGNNKEYSLTLTFNANKVFGGWVIGNESKECKVERSLADGVETWTYSSGGTPYYRENHDLSEDTWTYESYSNSVWSECSKTSERYYLMSGADFYIPDYTNEHALYTDTFKKVENWTNTPANKEKQSLGNDDYEDQFGNIWHKNGVDDYTVKEYKVYRERQYLPGDVVPADTKALIANWIEPDVYTKQQTITWTDRAASITNDDNLPQAYMKLERHGETDIGLRSNSYSGTTVTQTSGGIYEVRFGDGRTAPSMYGSIYLLSRGTTYYIGSNNSTNGIPAGTYRSMEKTSPSDTSAKAAFKHGNYAATTSGNVIVDNVRLQGCGNPGSTHGSGSAAFYGTGNILIMGVALESDTNYNVNGNKYRDFQVYGGKSGGSLTSKIDADLSTPEIDDKRMVYTKEEDSSTVSIATCLIIHSGCYYNVIAGNCGGNIGTTGAQGIKLSTYMVMKGGMVGDTVIGATSGANSNTFGHKSDDPNDPISKTTGGTFVYITGAFMPGDDWVDRKTGDFEDNDLRNVNFDMVDVSVINGASTKGSLWGTSHVFITDHASVYDVTAAGRESISYTTFSYLEVSGTATVRHAACGGVMNGMSKDYQLVDNTYVSIQGDCKVASVYGSGYDIYDAPSGSSMKAGGTITVDVLGGTIGSVYGGGYRGSIGDSDHYDRLTISINITGGHILDSVYGGGSGGVDKAKHFDNGTRYKDNSGGFADPVGKSYVYGNINVTVSGDTVIDGSVYGGGKSVSALKSYKAYQTFTVDSKNPVALTYGEINVVINGGTIGGSVFGGGRGAEWEYVTYQDGTHGFEVADTTKTVLMKSDGTLNIIDWFEMSGNNPIEFYTTEGYKASGGTHFIYRDSNGVYSGAYLQYARLTGDTFVKITGGEIAKSVYGGGSNGRVLGVTTSTDYIKGSTNVEITGGRIGENVFGGGLGIEGIVAVTGNRNVFINMDTADMNSENPADIIYGSVYGGSSVGDDGPYNGVNKVDTKDTGTPANGFPNTEGKYRTYLSSTDESNSNVIITQALIGNPYNEGKGNSVFGGGFMGKTYGYVNIYVGYDYVRDVDQKGAYNGNFSASPHTSNVVKTVFLNSIYAGGDISVDENGSTSSGATPFDPEKPLVFGGGSARVYGNGSNGNMKIVGCMMGSGNSCNTKWTTSLTIDNLINQGQMTGIHRANSLLISQSVLDILSRSTVTPVAGSPSKSLSLFMIDDLTLKYDSTVIISAPMDYIANFHSLSKDNAPTTETSPSNRLVYTTGSTLYVRDSSLNYGMVEGYTVLEAYGQGDIGAYVLGNLLSSSGGFVVAKEGTYKAADQSNMGNNIKCWFIAGTQNKVITMNMPYSDTQSKMAVTAPIDIVKMQAGTKIRYTGATFTTISTDNHGNSFEFVRPGTEDASYKFGMLIGYASDNPEDNLLYADTQRYLSIEGAAPKWVTGTYYSDDPAESRGSYEPMRDEESSSARTLVPLSPVDMINKNRDSAAGTYKFDLMFTGMPENTTMYVGYMTINLQEVDEVTYEAMDEHGNMVLRSNTMVTNNINIRVDLYVIGSGSVWTQSGYKVVLKAEEDINTHEYSGYSEIIIPTGFVMGKLVLSSVTTENVPAYESIKISAVINQDSTTGWMTINNPVIWTQNGDNGSNQPIGTMSGTIVATIRYSIEGFNYPDLESEQYPVFSLHFVTTDKNNQKVPSDVEVTIKPKPTHTVTFVNEYDVTTYGHYSDGSYLSASMFSSLGTNFIGWYLDSDFNNMFDYKMPITKDMTLYARFSFIVTFDNMNGTSSVMYIASSTGGAQLNENNVPKPQYSGYEFKGWYKDSDGIIPWDYAYDAIVGDTRLYAKWVGTEVKVNFFYYKDGNWLQYRGGGSEVGGIPDEVAPDVSDEVCLQSIDRTTQLDIFGNHYTRDGMVYTMDTKSLYGPGEREYKYVVSEDKYYVYTHPEWVEVTDEDYLEDLKDLRGYSFKNRYSMSPLTYYMKIDSDSYRKVYGTLVRPVVTNDYDQFGNHYTAGEMDWAVVWTSDVSTGMFKLVLSTGEFYKNTGTVASPVWSNTPEGTAPSSYYLRDRYDIQYDVGNNFGASARYLMAESGFFMLLSDMMIVSPSVDTQLLVDQFGNTYTRVGTVAPYTYEISEYHFFRTELQLKYDISGGQYYEKVGTDDVWISYTGQTNGLYFKDTYGYHYLYDGGNTKYTTSYLPSGMGNLRYPDSYVMGWFDGTPFNPTVRYGSTFNTIDPTLSTDGNPVNILDCAQEGVQALLGDDKFIRWQAYYNNDPYAPSSFGIYSDTVLTSGMVDLSVLAWQSGMPEINLYAVTAKVAIFLDMNKNVNDASASVAAPSTFLVYPTPNYIYWTNEYFDHDCPSIVEVEDKKKYTDAEGSSYYYKVKDQTNQYVTEDGRTLFVYDETYGYYGMVDLNFYEYVSSYEGEQGDFYVDKYENVYENGHEVSDLIECWLYSANEEGVKYRIEASTGDFQIEIDGNWVDCDPVPNYYYLAEDHDGHVTRFVKIDDTHYRAVDWLAEELEYTEPDGEGICHDTIGLNTTWRYEAGEYTLLSCDTVYRVGSEPGYTYKAVRTEQQIPPGTIVEWVYSYSMNGGVSWTNMYRELYNPAVKVWMYYTWDGDSWEACNKDNDFYLKDSTNNEYTRFNDDEFGRHEWVIVEAEITDNVDQFGNIYDGETLLYSIVYLFENKYRCVLETVNQSAKTWIYYEYGEDAKFDKAAIKQVDDVKTPHSGETYRMESDIIYWDDEEDDWGSVTYKIIYYILENNNAHREIQSFIQGEWTPVYREDYNASTGEWTYWLKSGEYTETQYSLYYYKDKYNNHYISYDNIDYNCVVGSETYYSFTFKLNEATRNGYKLSGWHNTHVNIDDALYPSSGLNRTIKLFYHEENGMTVINKEVLQTTDILGLPVTFINVNYDEYEAETPEYSYATYKGKALPRLDDTMKTYSITYLAQWAPMSYTVTLTQPAVGHIDAFLVSTDGERTPITSGVTQARYGDRIELSYSASGVYQFNRWITTGECEVENVDRSTTTMVIHGNSSVSVSEIGERLVTFTLRFDAGALKPADVEHVSVWVENSLTGETIRLQHLEQTGNFEIYRAYVPLNSSDPNEEYLAFVKYDEEVYYLKTASGELRITKDGDVDHAFELISARIRQSIQVKDDEGRLVNVYSSIDGVHLTQDMQTELKISDRTVVKVTRYVGVSQQFLENNRDIINNPYNGIPPVKIFIDPGFDYTTFEGFPDVDEYGRYFFNINENYNYHKSHSYELTEEHFDLNWTRTDAPAEIIVQLITNDTPGYNIRYTVGNPGGDSDLEHWLYNGTTLARGDSLVGQIALAEADLRDDVLSSKNMSIQGWYYDADMTDPVDYDAVIDTDVVSSLERNKDNTTCRVYAKVIDTDKLATITVKIYEEDETGALNLVRSSPQRIVDNGEGYVGTVLFDEKAGFHIRKTAVYTDLPAGAVGSGTFTVIDNTVVSYSIGIIYGGLVKTGGVLELTYDRNTVTLQINKHALESDTGWVDDKVVLRVGASQALPVITKGLLTVNGWTASPTYTPSHITKDSADPSDRHFTYTVGMEETGTVYLSAQYSYESPVNITFISSKGYYSENLQSRITVTIEHGDRVTQLPELVLPDGYTLNETNPYPGYTPAMTFTQDASFTAKLDIVEHNFTFRSYIAEHSEVSATNDSSSELLTEGKFNSLQHHSEISIIVKPAKGRALAINETKDWAYIKQNGGDPVDPIYTELGSAVLGATYRDQFYNGYVRDGENYNLVYSLIWAYNTTSNQAHTAGSYTSYIVMEDTGKYYKNTGTGAAPVLGAECDPFGAYFYKIGGTSAGDDYAKYGEEFQRRDWVPFTSFGTPVKLSDDRGYLWTFFLDSDTDIVVHTSVISININFVVNGELIDGKDGENMRVWGLTGSPQESQSYLFGNNIPMYSKVEFFGYSNDPGNERHYSDVHWYKDRACTIEFPYTVIDVGGHLYHKYEYLATDDLTVYTVRGKVAVNLYNSDASVYRAYLLDRDGEDCITLPELKYLMDGYVFVGWGTKDNEDKIVFQYGPQARFDPSESALYLYAYYLKGGVSQSTPYDGDVHTVEITQDTGPGQAVGNTLHIRYSDEGPISSLAEGVSVLEYEDFVETTVYYYGELTSAESHEVSRFSGSFEYSITKVELYIIAPSASFVESYDNEGNPVVHTVSSGSINMIATTPDGKVPNPDDIAGIVLDTNMYGYSDRIAGIGSVRTAASIFFAEGKADDYIVHYVDGSLVVYPMESARYMYGGF